MTDGEGSRGPGPDEEGPRGPGPDEGAPPPRSDGPPDGPDDAASPSSPDGSSDEPLDDEGPIGIFPSWGWVYGTVLVWFVVVVAALYVLTVTLDFGAP